MLPFLLRFFLLCYLPCCFVVFSCFGVRFLWLSLSGDGDSNISESCVFSCVVFSCFVFLSCRIQVLHKCILHMYFLNLALLALLFRFIFLRCLFSLLFFMLIRYSTQPVCTGLPPLTILAPHHQTFLFARFQSTGQRPRLIMVACDSLCPLAVPQSTNMSPRSHTYPYKLTMHMHGPPQPILCAWHCCTHVGMFCYVSWSALACVFGLFACVF